MVYFTFIYYVQDSDFVKFDLPINQREKLYLEESVHKGIPYHKEMIHKGHKRRGTLFRILRDFNKKYKERNEQNRR